MLPLAHMMAALLLIPFGLRTLMRGNEGLNTGRFGAGEAGVMSISGAAMILAGIALLVGVIAAGMMALAALLAATAVGLRQQQRTLGRRPRPGDMAGRVIWVSVIVLFIFLGWR